MLWKLLDLAKPRPYGLVLGAMATFGALLAVAGALLALDWFLVTYPGKNNWQTYEQRTPSWLWQAGVALTFIGSAALTCAAIAAAAAERQRLTHRPPVMPRRLYIGLMTIAVHVLAIWLASVTVGAAETSELRMRAWLSVGLVALGSLIGWKFRDGQPPVYRRPRLQRSSTDRTAKTT